MYGDGSPNDEAARAKSRRKIMRIALAVTVGPAFFFLVFGAAPAFIGFEAVTLRTLESCPAVVTALGQPIRRTWLGLSYGNTQTGGGRGHANWVFPVRGPRGRASIELNARETGGQWSLSSLVITTAQGTLDAIRCAPVVTAASIRATHADATVATVVGAPGVAVGDSCRIDVRPGDSTYACRAEIRCGSTTLYGGG
ncbi:MAG: cytochrome c oxidase assembly factor Coa1 family protein, partial [Deltaproteobacteria bacterium]